MALSFQKFQAFVEAEAEGKHDFENDQFMVALCATAPLATNAVLADLTQISYTNCSSRVCTKISSGQTGGVYRFILNPLLLTAVGGSFGPFRYIALYNNTATNKDLVGFYDYGSNLTFNAGESILIGFDAALGVFSIA